VVSTNGAGAVGWLLFVGSSVHVASTGCLFFLPEVRSVARGHPCRYWWVPSGLIALAALISAVLSPSRLAWLPLVFFAWQFWHYQKQNLGMAALAAASHRVVRLTSSERLAIRLAGMAGLAGLVARPGLLGLDVHSPLGAMWAVAVALCVVSTGYGLVLLAGRRPPERPAAFSAVFVLSLVFWVPMFVFASPYAAVGGMTIAHGFQYLLLVGLVLAGPSSGHRRVVSVGLGLNTALLGGALLSWASHLHAAPPSLRVLFGAYVGVAMAHFVVDGGLWRGRSPGTRALLAARVPYLVSAGVVPVAGGSADVIG
jgi:hypothetical protein